MNSMKMVLKLDAKRMMHREEVEINRLFYSKYNRVCLRGGLIQYPMLKRRGLFEKGALSNYNGKLFRKDLRGSMRSALILG